MAVQTGSSQELIDGLIGTYRDLNLKVRQIPEERARRGSDGNSVYDVVRRLRDDELRFSQALKERITGVPIPDIFGKDHRAVVGTEHSDDTTAVVISQFGTAREATLAILHSLDESGWDETVEGGTTIRSRIQELVENDRKQLDRILSMLPTRS